ncbi:MAG: hypothetical protein RLZ98_3642, partial [Pseudomonadota bacterium]
MASVCNDRNGTRRVTFVTGDGKHRSLRLGKVSRKQADTFRIRIEQLLQDKALGAAHDGALLGWIKGLPITTRKRLEAAGLLTAAPNCVTLSELIERFLRARTVKTGTMATYKQCTDSLLEYFGADTPLDEIMPADAEEWRASIARTGRVREKKGPRTLAPATVAKRTNIAKAIFSKAKAWKLLTASP